MAGFVTLVRDIPDPNKDAINALPIPKSGKARVGLWGWYDLGTRQEVVVKVVRGPGTATAAGQRGSDVMAYDLAGLTADSVLQAFLGDRPWTLPMPVVASAGANLADLNKALLGSGNIMEAAVLPGRNVEYMPLPNGFGGPLKSVNGLAVHITAGRGLAKDCFGTFKSRNVSTHFVIDRVGNIVQFVAASLTAYAQGPGNPHYLSVELVGAQGASNISQTEGMTEAQLATLKDLWKWVLQNFRGVKPQLAIPYVGQKTKVNWTKEGPKKVVDDKGNTVMGGMLGYGLDGHYAALAQAFVDKGYAPATSDNLRVCIDSVGLSCHWWLDYFPKSCPGAPIMAQMPQVLGYPAVEIEGSGKYAIGPEV